MTREIHFKSRTNDIEKLKKWLISRISEEIGLEPRRTDPEAPLSNYLLGGFQSSPVVGELERLLKRRLPSSILYERRTISALAQYLSEISRPETDSAISGRNVQELLIKS